MTSKLFCFCTTCLKDILCLHYRWTYAWFFGMTWCFFQMPSGHLAHIHHKGKTRMPYIVNHSLIHPCTDLELLNSKRFHHDAQIFHCMKKGIDLWVDPAWRNNTMVFFPPPPFGKSCFFFRILACHQHFVGWIQIWVDHCCHSYYFKVTRSRKIHK